VQLTLDGRTSMEAKLEQSIAILREYEPPEGYYLAFSGGKDSVALKAVAEIAAVKYDAHYNMTTVDPPELTRFIRREFPDVQWNVPEQGFMELVRTKGLPTRRRRWCCAMLKEGRQGNADENRVVLLGVRAEESRARSRYGIVRHCRAQAKWLISPLLAWSEEEVWAFHAREGLPHCGLYDEGWSRLGCVICPFNMQAKESMERWPGIWRATKRAGADYYAKNEAAQARFANYEAFWDWWVDRSAPYPKLHDEQPPTLMFGGVWRDEPTKR